MKNFQQNLGKIGVSHSSSIDIDIDFESMGQMSWKLLKIFTKTRSYAKCVRL